MEETPHLKLVQSFNTQVIVRHTLPEGKNYTGWDVEYARGTNAVDIYATNADGIVMHMDMHRDEIMPLISALEKVLFEMKETTDGI